MVHGANMGPTWGGQDPGGPHVGPMNRQDPGGPHVGPINFAIWVIDNHKLNSVDAESLAWFWIIKFGLSCD